MELASLIQAIDAVVSLATVVGNAAGAADKVGAIIAQRIQEGRTDWTDAERAEIETELQLQRARALDAAGLTPPPAVGG